MDTNNEPERIYTHPTSAEYHLNKWPLEESEYVGYVRADLAATRMREACVDALETLRDESSNAVYQTAYNTAIRTLQSLTLDQAVQKQ